MNRINNFIPKIKTLSLAISFSLILSACALIAPSPPPVKQLAIADYYLWLNTLDKASLNQEVALIKGKPTTIEYQLKKVMLYASPRSTIFNIYSAKTLLNKLPIQQVSKENLPFIQLLKDQLNQQIIQINQQELALISNEKELKTLLNTIEQLEEKIQQLKNLELTINQTEH